MMRIAPAVPHSLTQPSIKIGTADDKVEFWRGKPDGVSNQQVVMSGKHSDECGDYQWFNGGPNTPITDYPIVTAESFTAFRNLVVQRCTDAGIECGIGAQDFSERTTANDELFTDHEGVPIADDVEEFMAGISPFASYPLGKLKELQAHDDWSGLHYNQLQLRVFDVRSIGDTPELRQYCFDKAFSPNWGGRHTDDDELWGRINGLFDRSSDYVAGSGSRSLATPFMRYREHVADQREVESLAIRDDLVQRIHACQSEADFIPLRRECKRLELSDGHKDAVTVAVDEWYEAHKGKAPSKQTLIGEWYPAPPPKDITLFRSQLMRERSKVYLDHYGNGRFKASSGDDYLIGTVEFKSYSRQVIERVTGKSLNKAQASDLGDSLVANAPDEKQIVYRRYASAREQLPDGTWSESVYIDTGWPCRSAICVNAEGWHVMPVNECPIKFIREHGFTGELPLVSEDTPRLDWWTFCERHMPAIPKNDRTLVQAWVLDAMRSGKGFAILTLLGDWSGGKSAAAHVLVALLDSIAGDLSSDGFSDDYARLATKSHLYVHEDLTGGLKEPYQKLIGKRATGTSVRYRPVFEERLITLDLTGPQIITANREPLTLIDAKSRQLLIRCLDADQFAVANPPTDDEIEANLRADLPGAFRVMLDSLSDVLRDLGTIKVKPSRVRFKRLLRVGACLYDSELVAGCVVADVEARADRATDLDGAPAVQALIELATSRQGEPPVLITV